MKNKDLLKLLNNIQEDGNEPVKEEKPAKKSETEDSPW